MFESSLAIVGAVITIALVLGAAYSAFKSTDLRTTVKDQQARITSLQIDREELTRELAEEKKERNLLERRLELAEGEIVNLKEIVSGRIDFTALETTIEGRHKAQMLVLGDIKKLLAAKREGDY